MWSPPVNSMQEKTGLELSANMVLSIDIKRS